MNEVLQPDSIIVTPDVSSIDYTYVNPFVSSTDSNTSTTTAFGCPDITSSSYANCVVNSDMGELQLDLVFNYANQLALLEKEYKLAESLATISPTQTNQQALEEIRAEYNEVIQKAISYGGDAGGSSSIGGGYIIPVNRNGGGTGNGGSGNSGGGRSEKNPPGYTMPPVYNPPAPPNPPASPPWKKREHDDKEYYACLSAMPTVLNASFSGIFANSTLIGFKNLRPNGFPFDEGWYRSLSIEGTLTLKWDNFGADGPGCPTTQSVYTSDVTIQYGFAGGPPVITGSGYDETTTPCHALTEDPGISRDLLVESDAYRFIGYTCGNGDDIAAILGSSTVDNTVTLRKVTGNGSCTYNGTYGHYYQTTGSMSYSLYVRDSISDAINFCATRGGTGGTHIGNGAVLSGLNYSTGAVSGQTCTATLHLTTVPDYCAFTATITLEESDYPGGGGVIEEHTITREYDPFYSGDELTFDIPMPSTVNRQIVYKSVKFARLG